MLPLPNDELDSQIEQARKNAEHAERRGNFDSAHHEVLRNLLKQAEQKTKKGTVENAK